ncbi:MAG: efflux RND transporter permease subunit, partial [Candidatus Aerophobetes bacterium]|nr:efflux RND transporter permease subunit [Candidatus Aerophobetes bacterium]
MKIRISLRGMTNWVVGNPKKTIIFISLATLFFFLLIPRISFKADMKDMVPLDDPVIKDFDEAIEDFGSQEFLMVAVCSENIFNPSTLEKIHRMSEEFSILSGVEEVTTPLNIDLIEGSEGLIRISPAAEKVPENEREIREFRERISSSSQGEHFIARNGKAALISIALEPDVIATEKSDELVERVLEIIRQNKGPEEIYLAGNTYLSHYAKTSMGHDLYFLFALIVFMIMGFLYFCFRGKIGVLIPMLTVFMSIVWMIGFMAGMNYPFSIISVVAPTILVAIGSAYGIHIVNKYYETMENGLRGKEAVLNTMQEMNSPVIMTALTTIAGFLALNTSFVTPIRQFGTSVGFGVLSALILSLTFIPAVLTLEKRPPRYLENLKRGSSPGVLNSFLEKVGSSIARHYKMVVGLSFFIFCIFLLGIFKISTEADLVKYLGEDSPPVRAIRIVEDKFGGTSRLLIAIDTEEKDGVKNPVILEKMLGMEKYLDSLKYTANSYSLADLICEINQVLQGGDKEYYTIPETRRAVAQELLLFTMQGGSGIDSLVSYNFDKALISTQVSNVGT